ncbi:MAG: 2-amino-4-hydroxy-6-hydroxymethyldihydropteridine diphosphokinase [Gammaproteobacteria bacterium]|nr:2-amino-4-hydroxy-6-hydroxymethyldihydropteridine diphosphokinase [Gammaproteobacteria bacterium]
MTLLVLSLGSNIEAPKNTKMAIMALREKFGTLAISTIYESESVGFSGNNFLNSVVSVETDFPLQGISDYLKNLESYLGRKRTKSRFSDRTIDIDILLFGDSTGQECGLELPRGEILCNAFILRPLAELHPELEHSKIGVSYKSLWKGFAKDDQKLQPTNLRF